MVTISPRTQTTEFDVFYQSLKSIETFYTEINLIPKYTTEYLFKGLRGQKSKI